MKREAQEDLLIRTGPLAESRGTSFTRGSLDGISMEKSDRFGESCSTKVLDAGDYILARCSRLLQKQYQIRDHLQP